MHQMLVYYLKTFFKKRINYMSVGIFIKSDFTGIFKVLIFVKLYIDLMKF